MRLHEFVARHRADRAVVQLGPTSVVEADLRLPEGVVVGAEGDRLAVADLSAVLDGASLAPGVPAVLLWTDAISALPVGLVLTWAAAHGLRVVDAAPLEHRGIQAGLAFSPVDSPVVVWPYLTGAPVPVDDAAAVSRTIGEWLLLTLTTRAAASPTDTAAGSGATGATTPAGGDAAEVARLRKRVADLEASRTMRVGQAVVEAGRKPLTRVWGLPVTLRRISRESSAART